MAKTSGVFLSYPENKTENKIKNKTSIRYLTLNYDRRTVAIMLPAIQQNELGYYFKCNCAGSPDGTDDREFENALGM
jgi:hypothetical protein